MIFWRVGVSLAGNELGVDYDSRPPAVPNIGVDNQPKKSTDKRPEPPLPIFSILDSIDFSEHSETNFLYSIKMTVIIIFKTRKREPLEIVRSCEVLNM